MVSLPEGDDHLGFPVDDVMFSLGVLSFEESSHEEYIPNQLSMFMLWGPHHYPVSALVSATVNGGCFTDV